MRQPVRRNVIWAQIGIPGLLLLTGLLAGGCVGPAPTATEPALPASVPAAWPTTTPTPTATAGGTPTAEFARPSPTPGLTGQPPAGLIAFIGPNEQLWLMNSNGQEQRPLTSGGPVFSPAWSPDGQTLAYIQEGEAGRPEAVLYELATEHKYTVTIAGTSDGFYDALSRLSWSASGRYLLLDSGTCAQKTLAIIEIATGRTKDIITAIGCGQSYSWSPMGEQFAYIQGIELGPRQAVLYDLTTGRRHFLTADIPADWFPETLGGVSSDWFHETLIILDWSPHGRYLLLDSGTGTRRNLVVIDAATGELKNGLNATGYAWSPDGRRLAFGQSHPLETPIPIESGDSIDIAVLEIGRQTPQVVLEGTSEIRYYPRAWLPDGRLLYHRLDWDPDARTSTHSEWALLVDQAGSEPQLAEDFPPGFALDALWPIEFRGLANASHFSWSHDRRWVVFQAGVPPEMGIYLFEWLGNLPPHRLADGTAPSWQPGANPYLDLGNYFAPFVGWVRHIPEWMHTPPADRQVVRTTPGPDIDNETLLLDRQGTILARFTEADGGFPPGEIMWSWDKERAVVEFHPPAGSVVTFLIIDRDGHQLSGPLAAYWGPMWSPTRTLLAYHNTNDSRLYVVDGDGTPLAVSEPFSPRACSSCSVPPQWSPDGTRVALVVYIGDMARTTDIPLCLLDLSGAVSCVSLLDYAIGTLDVHWLDSRYLLIQGAKGQTTGPDIYRYFLLDTESGTIREVAESRDLAPTPEPTP